MDSNQDLQTIDNNVGNLCQHCGKRFSKAKLLKLHQKIHIKSKAFKCPDCGKFFKLKSSLQRHLTHTHNGIKKYKCDYCNASFAQSVNLSAHIDRLHPCGQKSKNRCYKCSECSCSFTKLNTLNRHIASRHKTIKGSGSDLLNNDESDPDQLAQLIVAQLKSLAREISNPLGKGTNPDSGQDKGETNTIEETTRIDAAEIAKTTLIDRLSPEGLTKIITVQTVKRQREKISFVCEHCAKEFKKSYNFIRHIRTHTKERPYKCSYCSKCFSTKSQLQAHFERMHILDEKTGRLSNQHKCCICGIFFDSIRQLDNHMRSHATSFQVQYTCKVCQAQFDSIRAFAKHSHGADAALVMLEQFIPEPVMLCHSVERKEGIDHKSTTCRSCGLRLNSNDALKKHLAHHKYARKFKCAKCGRSFANKLSLNIHKKEHKISKSFSCDKCFQKTFPTKSQLERHIQHVHENMRNFQCVYCPKCFKDKVHCKSHMRTHLKNLLDNTEKEEFRKPLEVKGVALINEINKTPISEKFVEIEMLPKCSKHQHQNFQIDMIDRGISALPSQADPKLHYCPHCTKKFLKASDLVRHVRIHTEERPFKCAICQKSFKLKSTLDEHQKTHQDQSERQMSTCQVCGKPYSSIKSLSVHLRIHTGVLPFKCECGRAFRTSGHRLSHMRASKTEDGQCRKSDGVDNIFNIGL